MLLQFEALYYPTSGFTGQKPRGCELHLFGIKQDWSGRNQHRAFACRSLHNPTALNSVQGIWTRVIAALPTRDISVEISELAKPHYQF